MSKSNYDKEINVLDEVRIRPLLQEINKRGIRFQYLISLDYPRRKSNYNKVISDNKLLKEDLRRFFGSEVKYLFFIEKHTGVGAHSGSYHRHILIEEPSFNTRIIQEYLSNYDPEGLFEMRMCGGLSESSKLQTIDHFLRCSRTTCNSKKGNHVIKIQSNLKRVLAYCTKQFERFGHPSYEVLDPTSSDIDSSYLLQYKQDGLEYKTRSGIISQRSYRTLRPAII